MATGAWVVRPIWSVRSFWSVSLAGPENQPEEPKRPERPEKPNEPERRAGPICLVPLVYLVCGAKCGTSGNCLSIWLEEQKRQRKYLVLGGSLSSEWGRLGENLWMQILRT
jgi:hypothetical protein